MDIMSDSPSGDMKTKPIFLSWVRAGARTHRLVGLSFLLFLIIIAICILLLILKG
jgi:uncharacterized protein YqhQ